MMKWKRALWALLYLVLIALPCVLYARDALANNLPAPSMISGLLGLAAYALFALEFLLTSRPKFIDRQFGLDRVYRFHMAAAVTAVILAFAHKLIKDAYYQESFQTELGNLALLLFALIGVFSAFLMVDRLFFKAAFAGRFRAFLRKHARIPYQHKVLIHNLVTLGMAGVLVHVLLAYSVRGSLALELTLIAYFATPALFYLHHKVYKRYFDSGKRYVVSDIVEECGNIVTARFKPASGGKVFPYLPGQFLYVRVKNPEIPGDEHPFTISSSPETRDSVSVTVKQLGDFSCALNHLKAGDAAIVDGPFGSFSYLKQPKAGSLCFLAGGIGITPFLSMLRSIAANEPDREVVLLWGVRDASELICYEELRQYAEELKRFRLIPVVSNDLSYAGEKGFITAELIRKYVKKPEQIDYFICGPGLMLDMQLKNLKEMGVSKKKIHFEGFAI